jgi:hypothetical protein
VTAGGGDAQAAALIQQHTETNDVTVQLILKASAPARFGIARGDLSSRAAGPVAGTRR